MSIPLEPAHLALVTTHPVRVVVPALLSDPAGPLGECAARPEDAPAAYLLGVLYRRSRYEGILHGKPPFEADPLFANRIRTTARRALDPFAWMVDLSRKLGVRWEALPEDERLWWRARAHDLAAWSFYASLDAHRADHGPYGLLWGLRAQESRGRRFRYAVSGPLYQHATEGWRCSPIADWSALDVHAYLWARGHALHPVYLCIDPGMDPLGIRTDWWFSVGWHLDASAHFGWLRRWWPACWRLAVEIDPEVGRLS